MSCSNVSSRCLRLPRKYTNVLTLHRLPHLHPKSLGFCSVLPTILQESVQSYTRILRRFQQIHDSTCGVHSHLENTAKDVCFNYTCARSVRQIPRLSSATTSRYPIADSTLKFFRIPFLRQKNSLFETSPQCVPYACCTHF